MEFMRFCKNHFKYKIYKFILYLIIAVIIFLFSSVIFSAKVNAATTNYWGYDVEHFTAGWFFDCTESGYCPNSITTASQWGMSATMENKYPGFVSSGATTVANDAGIMFAFYPNMTMRGTGVYSVKLYICNQTHNARAVNVNFSTGTTSTNTANFTYPITGNYYTGWNGLDITPYEIIGNEGNSVVEMEYCTALTKIFQPNSSINSTVIGFQFTTSETLTGQWFAVGYDIDYLGAPTGLTTSQVQSIVTEATSDLATASDIEEVEQSIATEFAEVQSQNETIIDQNEEAETTRKGIWQSIKDLPNAFMDMLKGLFLPSDNFFNDWFNDLKAFIEEKLGFLAIPFTLIIDFVNYYLDLDSNADIIINIPDITVPNFEDHVIIEATTLNWSDLLNSKEALKVLWILYLDFIDVFIILNFIGLCEVVYARIFGGNTTNYEYYTVEDSYTYDNNTGEVTGARRNERTTTRKRV